MSISITLIIVAVTAIISYQALNNRQIIETLKHYPYAEARDKSYYRMLSGGFVHGSMMHLLINMYVLYTFGEYVENKFVANFCTLNGRMIYLVFYLAIIFLADIPSFLKHKNNPSYASVGASGATSGIIFVFIMINPWSMLGLMFIIPIPAIIFGVLYLIYSSWAANTKNDGIDHSAHFWGAIAGIVLALILMPDIGSIFIHQLKAVPWLN